MSVTSGNIHYITSGNLNTGTSTEFKFDDIIQDAARKSSDNTFTVNADKTFSKEVKAKEADVKKLKGVTHYDDINLVDYRNNMLVVADEANPGK